MSVVQDMNMVSIDTCVYLVKTAIANYLRGIEIAYRHMGDDGQEFRRFVDHYLVIQKADDYIRGNIVSNSPDFRGLVAVVMDDLGMRDYDRRDMVMQALTGVTREEQEEQHIRHRISQGDHWLTKS